MDKKIAAGKDKMRFYAFLMLALTSYATAMDARKDSTELMDADMIGASKITSRSVYTCGLKDLEKTLEIDITSDYGKPFQLDAARENDQKLSELSMKGISKLYAHFVIINSLYVSCTGDAGAWSITVSGFARMEDYKSKTETVINARFSKEQFFDMTQIP